MQNVHELSHPTWMVTHAVWSCSRHAGQRAELTGDAVVVLVEDLHDRLAGGAACAQQLGRAGEVVGAEHHVDVAGALHNQLTVLLGEATADRDLQLGALAPSSP